MRVYYDFSDLLGMKKNLALGIFLSLAVFACDINQEQQDNPNSGSPKELPSAKPVAAGMATFQKKDGEPETYDITVHDRGHKKFYGEGDAPFIVVDWSDGYSSAYMFGLDYTGLVFDYDPKAKKWGAKGAKMKWSYLGENVSIISENGAKTVLGGVKRKIEPMLAGFKKFQKQQAAEYEARQRKERMFTDMDLGQLETEFKQNRIRARRNYEGKVITLRGQVDAIYDDKLTVCQDASSECVILPYGYLKPGLADFLANRDQGDKVTVTGTLDIEVALGEPTFSMGKWRIRTGYSDAPLPFEP